MSNDNEKHTLKEELWVSAQDLKDTIIRLVKEGNARSLVIWNEEGKKLLEIPLTGGLAVGGAMVLLAPFLAGIVAIAAIVKKVKIEIIRDREDI